MNRAALPKVAANPFKDPASPVALSETINQSVYSPTPQNEACRECSFSTGYDTDDSVVVPGIDASGSFTKQQLAAIVAPGGLPITDPNNALAKAMDPLLERRRCA